MHMLYDDINLKWKQDNTQETRVETGIKSCLLQK